LVSKKLAGALKAPYIWKRVLNIYCLSMNIDIAHMDRYGSHEISSISFQNRAEHQQVMQTCIITNK